MVSSEPVEHVEYLDVAATSQPEFSLERFPTTIQEEVSFISDTVHKTHVLTRHQPSEVGRIHCDRVE